jgi:hypothetical protein
MTRCEKASIWASFSLTIHADGVESAAAVRESCRRAVGARFEEFIHEDEVARFIGGTQVSTALGEGKESMMCRQRGRVGLIATALVWVMATGASADVTTEQSASLLIFPKIIADGTRDTIIQITNTSNSMVHAHCFYVNGALSDPEDPRSVPLWQEIDFDIWLTKQQPTHWVVSEGRLDDSSDQSCRNFPTPITECNGAGIDPGRVPPVVPDFTGELKCVEVDASGAPVGGNHLIGEATIIGLDICNPDTSTCYLTGTACSSNADCTNTVDPEKYNGIGILAKEALDDDGVLCLGGNAPTDDCPLGAEYNACPDTWILNHFVDGVENPVLGDGTSIETNITVVPCEQNFETQDPESVVIQFQVFDEFESAFSASTTVTCWANLNLSDISNVFEAPPFGPLDRTFVQTRMRPSRGTDSGFLVVAQEHHRSSDDFLSSAAFNVHIEGERTGPDLITIPSEQLQ